MHYSYNDCDASTVLLSSLLLVLVLPFRIIIASAERLDETSDRSSRSLLFERICEGGLGTGNTDAFGTKQPRQHSCEEAVGTGRCWDTQDRLYDFCGVVLTDINLRDCQRSAERLTQVVGVTHDSATRKCYANWQNGATKAQLQAACPKADSTLSESGFDLVESRGIGQTESRGWVSREYVLCVYSFVTLCV